MVTYQTLYFMANFPMSFFTDKHQTVPEPDGFSKPVFTGTIPSVSYSTLKNFEACQYHAYLDKVALIGRVSGPAADRGTHIHELLEMYVKGEFEEFDWSLVKSKGFHQRLVENFKADYLSGLCYPEIKFGFTKDMQPTDFETAKIRGVIDQLNFLDIKKTQALLYDYKTGSDYAGAAHRDQLLLYVLVCFILYPDLQYIQSAPIYLDHRKPVFHNNYKREDLDILWPRYHERLMRVLDATNFVPNPNGFSCKWCPHKKIQPTLNQVEPACEFAVY